MRENNETNFTEKTTRNIAYALIGLYGACLVLVFIAAFTNNNGGKEWVSLFRDAFLILGGSLGTVIGYYFGSKGTRNAEERALQAKNEAENAIKQSETEKKLAEELKETLKRNFDRDDPRESSTGTMSKEEGLDEPNG